MKHYEAADVPQKAVVVKKLCRGDAVAFVNTWRGSDGVKMSVNEILQ